MTGNRRADRLFQRRGLTVEPDTGNPAGGEGRAVVTASCKKTVRKLFGHFVHTAQDQCELVFFHCDRNSNPVQARHTHLQPGEAMYLSAGILHAYLEGSGMEIMASSNNVLRGGLTRKHVDVPELLATLYKATVDNCARLDLRGRNLYGLQFCKT